MDDMIKRMEEKYGGGDGGGEYNKGKGKRKGKNNAKKSEYEIDDEEFERIQRGLKK